MVVMDIVVLVSEGCVVYFITMIKPKSSVDRDLVKMFEGCIAIMIMPSLLLPVLLVLPCKKAT